MFTYGACTLEGRKHENQDAVLMASGYLPTLVPPNSPDQNVNAASVSKGAPFSLAFVADGVSSCKSPQRASHLAADTFWQRFTHIINSSEAATPLLETCLSKALEEVNNVLYFTESYERQPALLSTFSGLLFEQNRAHIVNVGDSRVYRLYQGQLECLTRDHSHRRGFYKGALASALGAHERPRVDYSQRALVEGETYLIATDGVYEHIEEPELKLLLEQASGEGSTQSEKTCRIAEAICDAALENGSRDNLSCIVVQIPSLTEGAVSSNFLQRSEKHFPPELSEGDRLDNFLIKKTLHASPRSQVYLAEDTETGAQRVIKTPSEYFNDDPLYIRRFFKEEKIGLSLQHVSILRFYPKLLDSRYIYHVTEFVEGQTLREYIDKNAPLSLSVTREIIGKIVVALRVLHRAHLLHQDLKPDNIVLADSGEVKLIDLGSVGSLVFKETESSPPGALDYTAPEYYRDEPRGIFSDVFSLAVIAYEMFTKKTPFSGQKIATAKTELKFKPPHTIRPELPAWLTDVFEHAFSIPSRARYQTPSELHVDLDPQNHDSPSGEPLLIRNPVLFWKSLSGVLGILVVFLLYQLSQTAL